MRKIKEALTIVIMAAMIVSQAVYPGMALETEPEEASGSVSVSEEGGVIGVQLYGDAAVDAALAEEELINTACLGESEINSVVSTLFDEPAAKAGGPQRAPAADDPDVPRQGDGSNIEVIAAKWITQDTVDNGDSGLLYYRPEEDDPFSVRLQINYALSGEHPYNPGDITITIPKSIFTDRNGKDYSDTIIPFPEDPSTKSDFNWKLIGDNFVLTNTKTMSAATKGYIQFAFDELIPHELVDMQVSEPFDAYIEVVTHKGNIIGARSNALTAQFDTEARIEDVSKKLYGEVERVPASAIPASQRIEGETEYIKVNWYVWGEIRSNTLYSLDQIDFMPDEYGGFVVGATTEDGLTREVDGSYSGWEKGKTSYYYYSTAYPASRFEPDVDYTFHNSIRFRVTEADPEAEVTNPNVQDTDPRLVTEETASAQVVWSYSLPEWQDPRGHFMVVKNGNDNKANGNLTRHKKSEITWDVKDLHIWGTRDYTDGWYGIYPSALNDIQEEKDPLISYTINSVGYAMPWMFDAETFGTDGEMASRKSVNYTRPVTITTEDTGVRIGRDGEPLTVLEDYEFVSLEFPAEPWIYVGVPHNINPDGTWTALTAGDGTFLYSRDMDYSHFPEFRVEILRNGMWEEYASADWSGGSVLITLKDGTILDGSILDVPSDTENFRVSVTLRNTATDAEANIALQAAINYDIRPVIRLKKTEQMEALIQEGFSQSNTPELLLYNSCNMTAERADTGDEIVSIDKDGYDCLRGYTTDTMVYPIKNSTQTLKDVDNSSRVVTIHYEAKVEEQSLINDKRSYEQAIADGRLAAETGGVWRDLLPKGVTPVLSSIRLREGDRILDAYTIVNYKNSGRTLLVVEADLTPVPERYRSGDVYYYMDVPTISFDATYGFDALTDYGDYIHNVIAFESTNDLIGTVDRYKGEPDDPYSSNNIATAQAFSDDTEKDIMKDLDPERDDPSVVYAGTYTQIDILSAARTSLFKDVMVNDDGLWSDGLYYGRPDENKRIVYEGGLYSYRLRMMPDDETVTKGMVLFDSLENFHAGDGNDAADIDAPRWQGTLMGVDVSQLVEKGCAPVVYYSTVAELELSNESDPNEANAVNTDLTNTDIWVKAEDYTGELSDVKAVAIDASAKAGGGDFELRPGESAVAFINMRAPSGDEAREYIAQKGDWGGSANAYNNAYMIATTVDIETGEEDSDSFVRKDYTKVGLMEYSYRVTKVWDDDNDRDGLRPDADTGIIIHLYADGEDTGLVVKLPVIDEESGEEIWEASFDHIPFTDPEGSRIHYTAVEDVPEGYMASVLIGDGITGFTNIHIPQTTEVSGTKSWVGDDKTKRPQFINVRLYADGEYVRSKAVFPNAYGSWEYSFTNLPKYKDGGVEIVYTVEESLVGDDALDSYVPEVDGSDLINVYHPYGDLMVTKTVTGATEVSADREFTFTFNFTKDEDGQEIPVFTEYEYEVLGPDGEQVSTGMISNNGTISIKGGQTIHVMEIDEYVRYVVTEADADGFVLDSSGTGNTYGTILPNVTTEAMFTNKYSASGRISLEAEKTLNWRQLQRNLFRFELYRVNEDGSETLIRTAGNERSDEVVTNEDGVVESSHASVTFGAIRYTQADHGKTFIYRIKEADTGKDGYTYDTTVYTVKVTVLDKGDGTLDIVPVYYLDDVEVDSAAFENDYEASGSVELKAWKDLHGRPLMDREFLFLLEDENGEPVQARANNADGTVTFGPLEYDQTSIGKTYFYVVREYSGYDRTVIYDDSIFGYYVEVIDNGDGTLGFNQGLAGPVYGEGVCGVCGGTGYAGPEDTIYTGDTPIAHPAYDGSGEYASVAPEELEYMDAAAYEAAVKIMEQGSVELGEVGTYLYDGSVRKDRIPLRYTLTGVEPELAAAWRDGLLAGSAYRSNIEAGIYDTADHADVPETDDAIWYLSAEFSEEFEAGKWNVYYQLGFIPLCPHCGGTGIGIGQIGWNKEGEDLPVFRNTLNPGSFSITKNTTNAQYADPDQEFTFKIKLIGEDVEDGELEYFITYTGTVRPSVAAADRTGAAGRKSAEEAVTEAEEAVTEAGEAAADFEEAATETGEQVMSVAPDEPEGAEGPTEPAVREETVSKSGYRSGLLGLLAEPAYAAEGDIATGTSGGCTWVIDADGVMTISPTNGISGTLQSYYEQSIYTATYPLWHNYKGDIKKVVVEPGVKTAGGCHHLFADLPECTEMDLSALDTSAATDMSYMFYGCKKLESCDVSGFNTAKVRNMHGMFGGCAALTELDVSGFNTGKVTDMGLTFYGCVGLTTLDVSGFDTGNVTTMSQMFSGCSSLRTLDVSGFDTSEVTDYGLCFMFQKCSSLSELDVSGFDTSKVISLNFMFDGCSSLTSLDVTNFDTTNMTSMEYVFQRCSSLASIDVSNFKTGNVTMMNGLFDGCSSLTSIDVSNFDTSNVEWMGYMFNDCRGLTTLDLSNFDTSSAKYMFEMFQNCSGLTYLDISSFDTGKVTNMRNMFSGCAKLCEVVLGENFSFKGNNITDVSRRGLLPRPSGAEYTGNWIREDEMYGPYSAGSLSVNYAPEMAGVWIWEKIPDKYTIYFSSGGASGYMSGATVNVRDDYVIPANKYYMNGYVFDHWDDGRGNTYRNRDTIPGHTYSANDRVTLTAVFVPFDNTITMKDGEFEVTLHGGETATFPNIPAGTIYQIYEETPDGWVLISQSNTSGSIWSMGNSAAYFTNRYEPGIASAQITGSKMLDGKPADLYNNFSFRLTEPGSEAGIIKGYDSRGNLTEYELPLTVDMQNGGVVRFPVFVYDTPGIHTYEIQEVNSGNTGIVYDEHVETVTVEVTDDGAGNMSATVTYDEDGVAFDNETLPGSLSIKKTADVMTDANKDDVFTVMVTLSDAKGLPYESEISWRIVDETGQERENGTAVPAGGKMTLRLKAGDTIVIPDLPAGTTYTVEEVDLPAGWSLDAGEGTDGTIAAGSESQVSFSNKYTAAGEAYIVAHKAMLSETPEEGQFTFELLDSEHELIERVTNDAVDDSAEIYDDEGNLIPNPYAGTAPVIFSPIEFTQDDIGKTFTYYIREIVGDDSGMIYDVHEETVTVKVVDAGHGLIKGEVTYDDDGAVFTNKLRPSALRIEKTTEGSGDPDAEFTFTVKLTDKDGAELEGEFAAKKYPKTDPEAETPAEPEEFTIASGGTFTLKGGEYVIIDGLPAGASYEVTETGDPDWTLTSQDGSTGTLTAGGQSAASFVNTYEPEPYSADGTVQIIAHKTLEGGTIKEEDEFIFELLNDVGDVIQTKPADEFGAGESTITFDEIAFTLEDMDGMEEKVFYFYIREQNGTDPNVTYDSRREIEIRVTVKDDGEGHLLTYIDYDTDEEGNPGGEARFTNVRRTNLKVVKKELGGESKALPGAEFTITKDGLYLNASGTLQEEKYIFTTDEKGEINVKRAPAGTYTLHEEKAPDGYLPADDIEFTLYDGETAVAGEIVNEVIVKDPKKVEVSVIKVWEDDDDRDGVRPDSLTVTLESSVDGEVIDSEVAVVTLDEANDWTAEVTDLPECDADGNVIEYTWKEGETAEYELVSSETEGCVTTLTNRHEIRKTSVAGAKTWEDENNKDGSRPASITVRLYADGEEIGSVTVTAEDNWAFEFKDLPLNNENGKEIVYTIKEDPVEGYTTEIDGFNITNTKEPPEEPDEPPTPPDEPDEPDEPPTPPDEPDEPPTQPDGPDEPGVPTGDDARPGLWALIGIGAAAAAGAMVAVRRRKKDK